MSLSAFCLVTLAFWTRSQAIGQEGKDKKPPVPKTVVEDIMVPDVGGLEQVTFINSEIERMWKENEITPAERCSDYEFIRRASLDIIGRIAKIDEIKQFLSDPPKLRRSRLIERLLASDEFPHHFATTWTTLLLTRSAPKVTHDQMYLYLFDELAKKEPDWSKVATDLITATGDSNENGAVNFILMHMGEQIKDSPGDNGKFDMVPVTSRTTKLFLGLQTQCTQCHDHPFNDVWYQKHFWGINAYFRQANAPNGRPMMGNDKKNEVMRGNYRLVDDTGLNKEGIVSYERRNAVLLYTKPRFLDGTKISSTSKKTRREELAEMITTSPYFGKAFVNRTWGHFFGISFTKDSVDDFGEHNPISHPELLKKLGEDWSQKYKHNPRDLIRWICNSKAYGLSSVANKTNITRDSKRFFSRMLLKAMTPEQLFESLMVATQSQAASNSEDRKKLREQWLNRLVVNFGDDEGNEQSFNGTVVQALLLMNGKEINQAISDRKNGTVANVLKQPGITPQKAMAQLYLAALNRTPTQEEYAKILNSQMILMPRVGGPRTPQERVAYFADFYEDLFWAILNSNEFFLNH